MSNPINLIKVTRSLYNPSRNSIHFWKQFKRWQEIEKEGLKEKKLEERKRSYIKLNEGLYITPEKESDVMPKKDLEDMTRRETGALSIEFLTSHTQMRYLDHSFDNIKRCKAYEHFQHLQFDQRFIPERLLFLGPDLAAAYFIVHRGGTIKFVGDNAWIRKDKKGRYSLPPRRVPGLYLEAIDASNTELMFEGFDNLYDLTKLRLLSLANCKYADDWTLSRVGTMFSESLEMLDLSNCKKISPKGLMGLRSLKNLKYLRLNGLNDPQGIAKATILLEEAIPNLIVMGVDYESALESFQKEAMLLEHERASVDAKGNIHIEDDNGNLYYVKGCINERPTVDDNDLPIVTSTIKMDVPKMSDIEFEELDRLTQGKLRHLLVGSPSAYSWTEATEQILSFEEKYKLKRGEIVDPKLLPLSKREDVIREVEKLEQARLQKNELNIKQISSS
ncbi:ATP synthase subunit s-like protein [Strongyloides ratti]|uniref:ATP synthase subunit s-like protein n=1 Tax=Strongyloides ratti TaxID=34506 RepID=A0A090LFJ5_STRRB|nr:ATP synthase subunit s-like protein [Strongyloides ratti]CEF68537.1 ATP synthase subunit s-like protein [Strongyloides ratti]